ncbi:MAG: universal stress protein [Dongiaceae bacterium]
MHILAATDFSIRSQRAVRRAGLLAGERDAELILVHVVDDDQPAALVDIEKREAGRYLDEQIESLAELRGRRCRSIVAAGDPFDGILQTAKSCAADMIVMGAHRKHMLRDILVGTTIERVIRTGHYPVLMVNREAARPYARVLAAVDMSPPSALAIKAAKALGLIDGTELSVVHGFHAFGSRKMSSAGVRQDSIDGYVAKERSQAAMELAAFLAANDFGIDRSSLRIEEGNPVDVIAAAVQETRSDLLLVGTHGRTGIVKILLGSVTEEVLRSIEADILAVPAPR